MCKVSLHELFLVPKYFEKKVFIKGMKAVLKFVSKMCTVLNFLTIYVRKPNIYKRECNTQEFGYIVYTRTNYQSGRRGFF